MGHGYDPDSPDCVEKPLVNPATGVVYGMSRCPRLATVCKPEHDRLKAGLTIKHYGREFFAIAPPEVTRVDLKEEEA